MTLEQNKQVALDALRVLETGDSVAADRIIAPDFINREADEDPNRPDRGLRGPAGVIATRRAAAPPVMAPTADEQLRGPRRMGR